MPVASPFYFAWVVPEDTTFRTAVDGTFGASHLRMDEYIFDFSLSQREGDFALLTMTIVNPFVGLLSAGREQWAHFAYDDGINGPRALFFGQILAQPDDMRAKLIQITLRGKPADFEATKETLAASLRTLPEYDPLMLSEEARSDPDAVLQARTALWHVDRVTHALTISDKIDGEDGVLNYGPDDIFYGSLRQRRGEQPPRKAVVEATFNFTQAGTGEIDLSARLVKEFDALSESPVPGTIMSYSAEGLIRDWPVPGDEIGAGWKFIDTNVEEGNGRFVPYETVAANSLSAWIEAASLSNTIPTTETMQAAFIPGLFKPTLVVGYSVERSFTEVLRFEMNADLQSVTADDAEPMRLSFSTNDVAELIDFEDSIGGSAPIGDRRRNSYLLTDRGKETAQYIVLRTRASLLDAARAISTDIGVRFEEIFNITCRKNVAATADRLPGGTASGKIIGYECTGSGDTGAFSTTVTIGSCIGKGASVVGDPGEAVYIDEDYIDEDYYIYQNVTDLLPPGDVTLSDYSAITPNDDLLNLFSMTDETCVLRIHIENHAEEQKQAIVSAGAQSGLFSTGSTPRITEPTSFGGWSGGSFLVNSDIWGNSFGEVAGFFPDTSSAAAPIVDNYTTVTLEMLPLTNGPFLTYFDVTVSDLMVPRQVDLEAS